MADIDPAQSDFNNGAGYLSPEVEKRMGCFTPAIPLHELLGLTDEETFDQGYTPLPAPNNINILTPAALKRLRAADNAKALWVTSCAVTEEIDGNENRYFFIGQGDCIALVREQPGDWYRILPQHMKSKKRSLENLVAIVHCLDQKILADRHHGYFDHAKPIAQVGYAEFEIRMEQQRQDNILADYAAGNGHYRIPQGPYRPYAPAPVCAPDKIDPPK